MATNLQLVQGEIVSDTSSEERDVEKLLIGFLLAVLKEDQTMNADHAKAGLR